MGIGDWFDNTGGDIFSLSASAWTALAAWLAVTVGVAGLIYARRRIKRAEKQSAELMQPNVAMYMEPSAQDWHLIELVVKNFGRTPAYSISCNFTNAPTVPRYENAYGDGYVDIVSLDLPEEIPFLAPSQEWRTVWDSALDRKQLGTSIESRFEGTVTYFDQPAQPGRRRNRKGREHTTPVVLDWTSLHPVERLELLTTHDLARQEKQKLELLRGVLTYLQNVSKETREDVIRDEINRMRSLVNETNDRWRQRYVDAEPRKQLNVIQEAQPEAEPNHEPYTQVINGRHRRDWQ
jgi:hypothetical protein